MMTPKEKAKDLLDKYKLMAEIISMDEPKQGDDGLFKAMNGKIALSSKKCALIAVDEICDAINWHEFESPNKEWEYWNKVKQEIEKL